ncbi:helix-turn-helix transcriptional regulator [Nocardiopsis sp. NPDC006198]|uniref:helix-turn-helix domain-containing protein n=1 Tax=Nocardiopsis sp. NPDC006198 TaxID=3154472 RepID=UPI00339DE2CA
MTPHARARIAARLRREAEEGRWPRAHLVQQIHEQARTPTVLMAWRLAMGWSQLDLAREIRQASETTDKPCSPGPSPHQISRWESSGGTVSPYYRMLLASAYGVTPGHLGANVSGFHPLTTPEGDDVHRRQFLTAAATTAAVVPLTDIRQILDAPLRRMLPASDLQHWSEVVDKHVTSYATTGPAHLIEALTPDLAEVSQLANRYPHQRDLQVITSRLCGLTGALHTDLDSSIEAQGWLRTAAGYARLADDAVMRTWLAMAGAMDAYYSHRPAETIRISTQAQESIGEAGGCALAQLLGLQARAHAIEGDRDAATEALHAARRVHEGAPVDDSFFGFPEKQLVAYSASVLSHTGDPAAWDVQEQAIELHHDAPVDQAVLRLERADFQLLAGDVDASAQTATQAVQGLAASERIPLLLDQAYAYASRLEELSPEAASDYRSHLQQ